MRCDCAAAHDEIGNDNDGAAGADGVITRVA
jgi:hypothetical protein